MLYNPPHLYSLSKRQQGFTLIELLMVITVILILAGITFGISRGAQNAQARTKAKAELATTSQAIEQFKSRYGDYPWHKQGEVDTNKTLLFALTGRLVLGDPDPKDTKNDIKALIIDTQSQIDANPKFLDDTKLSTSSCFCLTRSYLSFFAKPILNDFSVNRISALSCLSRVLYSAREVNILYGSSVPFVIKSSIKTPI